MSRGEHQRVLPRVELDEAVEGSVRKDPKRARPRYPVGSEMPRLQAVAIAQPRTQICTDRDR